MKLSEWLEGPQPMPMHERVMASVCFILGIIIGVHL